MSTLLIDLGQIRALEISIHCHFSLASQDISGRKVHSAQNPSVNRRKLACVIPTLTYRFSSTHFLQFVLDILARQ